LTFVWQDNNAVLGITTAFTAEERVERLRRRPIFYWLLDTCKTNAYLIWKSCETDSSHRLHLEFYDTLVDELLTMGLEHKVAAEGLIRPEHTEIRLDKPTYCAWDLKNLGSCVAGVGNKRKLGDVIVNWYAKCAASAGQDRL
jgi:hypothetical protein